MGNGVPTDPKDQPIDEVKVGSVVISIYPSPIIAKVKPKVAERGGAETLSVTEPATKTYESYLIPHYEGSERVITRRSTIGGARKYAKEVATRLSRDGARAEFLTDMDRRIYTLAQAAVRPMGMEVDEVCRRYAELQRRLKEGTLEEAVDFKNDHGQRIRHGVTTQEIFGEYVKHLEKRGAGDYHMRDTKRYVGGFIKAQPGLISRIQTPEIDTFLEGLGGKARNKNNHRDAIIAFFSFAQEKGFLPANLPHAAMATTEFFDKREKITSEKRALELLQPNDIYSPDEMRRLLAADTKQIIRPTLEIKAFSGVRTEEIVRLWWVMVAESEECIRVPDAVGKIDARRVPLLENLKRRLAAYGPEIKRGRVAATWKSANSVYHAWQRICKKAGVPYRRNAFRNSYFTYRLVIVGDPKKVAEEGGTSEEMLKKNYLSRAPVSRATAEEWFSL